MLTCRCISPKFGIPLPPIPPNGDPPSALRSGNPGIDPNGDPPDPGKPPGAGGGPDDGGLAAF